MISLERKGDQLLLPLMMHHSADSLPATVPVPFGITGTAAPQWRALHKFNTVGVYNLCQIQGVFPHTPSFFDTFYIKFLSADIAWWAAGAHNDGKHHHPNNTFHPMFHDFVITGNSPAAKANRKALLAKIQALIWDLVCFCFLCLFLLLHRLPGNGLGLYLVGNNIHHARQQHHSSWLSAVR